MMDIIQPLCDQCNTYHPPVFEGSKCPMAPEKAKDGQELDFNKIFDPLKLILKSQVDVKGVKDFDSFVKYMIVEITKAAESYKDTLAVPINKVIERFENSEDRTNTLD